MKRSSLLCASVVALVAAVTYVSAGQAPDATTLMVRAHEARATWNGFPGFAADLVVLDDEELAQGKLEVSASGELTLELSDKRFGWVERKLRSLAAHRMADGDREYDVSFADENEQHPLGRLIRINDDALMGSRYRIQDDVIREVHRTMDDTRFTISVMDVARNADGGYLPKFYTVSYWDTKTGALKSTSVVRDDWIRVGHWDLPARLLTVESRGDAKRSVRDIRLSNHRLLKVAEAGSP